MDENIVSKIRNTVERALDDGRNEFIIFPFGDVGIKTKQVLKECYGLTPSMIIDNKLCKFNSEIHSLNEMPHNNLERRRDSSLLFLKNKELMLKIKVIMSI